MKVKNINKIKEITKENYFNHYIEKNNLSFVKNLKNIQEKLKQNFGL